MVSLRVATERNELAKVERQIIAAKRDIRSLQTELGTRGRMTQLEQWNAEVLALSAPSSAQFLKDEFTLARLYRNDPTVADRSAEVQLASAATGAAAPAESAKPATPPVARAVAEPAAPQPPMIHRASFTTVDPAAKAKPESAQPERSKALVPASPDKPAAQRTASAQPKPGPERSAATKPAPKPGKPAGERTASAGTSKPEATSSRAAAKPAARPETLRAAAGAAAKPVREAAAPRSKAKGGDGN
jgi:hypothetical protein